MKKDCHLDLWVDCELELDLRRLAEEDDRPLSAYIRSVLQRHVSHEKGHSAREPEPMPAANSRAALSTEPYEVEFWRNKYLKAIGK